MITKEITIGQDKVGSLNEHKACVKLCSFRKGELSLLVTSLKSSYPCSSEDNAFSSLQLHSKMATIEKLLHPADLVALAFANCRTF